MKKLTLLPKNSNKIVLGQPLSGALYAYFDKELNSGNHIKASKHHSYYKTLYGKRFESNIEMALALSLIYDDIILVPADNPFPDYDKFQTDGEYYNPEFGLYFDWKDQANYRHIIDDKIKLCQEDKEINALMWNIPKHVHQQILHEVYWELSLATRLNVPLFTIGKRQLLAKRISQIEKDKEPELAKKSSIQTISNYLDITGLLFQPLAIDQFYYLKGERDLRNYAKSFVKVLDEFNPTNPANVKSELLLLIKEAISSDKIRSKISGVFEGGSTAMDYVGLIPGVGTVSGIVGIAADLTAKGIKKGNQKNTWFELASHIEKIKSLERINSALKNLE